MATTILTTTSTTTTASDTTAMEDASSLLLAHQGGSRPFPVTEVDNDDDDAPLLLQPTGRETKNPEQEEKDEANDDYDTNNTNSNNNNINSNNNNNAEIRRITRHPTYEEEDIDKDVVNDEDDNEDEEDAVVVVESATLRNDSLPPPPQPPRDFLLGISGWKETERDVPSILLALSQTPTMVDFGTNHNNNNYYFEKENDDNQDQSKEDHHHSSSSPPLPSVDKVDAAWAGGTHGTLSRSIKTKTTLSPQYVPRYSRGEGTIPDATDHQPQPLVTTTTTTAAGSSSASVSESATPTAAASTTTTTSRTVDKATKKDKEPTTPPVTAKKTVSETTKKKSAAKVMSSPSSSPSTTTTTGKKGSYTTSRRRRRERRKRRHTEEDAREAGYNSSDDEGVTIYELSPNDVLSGRGNGVAFYPGNIQFRTLVQEHKAAYLQAERDDKILWARTVIAKIQQMQPPGRFLEKHAGMEGRGEGLGVSMAGGGGKIMSPTKALEKTCQALREKLDWKSIAPLAPTPVPSAVPSSSFSSSQPPTTSTTTKGKKGASKGLIKKSSSSSNNNGKVTTSGSSRKQVSDKKGKKTVVKQKSLLPASNKGKATKIIKPLSTTITEKKAKAVAAAAANQTSSTVVPAKIPTPPNTASAQAVPTTTTLADADTAAAAAALMLASQHDGVKMRNQATTASTMPARLVSAQLNDNTALASQEDTSSCPIHSVTTNTSKTKVAAAPLKDVDTAAPMALARQTEASQDELSASMKRVNTTPPATQAGLASPRLNDMNPSQASFTAVNEKNAPFQLNTAAAKSALPQLHAAAAAAMDAHTAAAVLALVSQKDVNNTTNYGGNATMHQFVESSSSSSDPTTSLQSASSVYATVAARHYSPPPITPYLDIAPNPAAAFAAATTSASTNTAVSQYAPLARPAAMNAKKVKDSKKRVSPSASSQSNRKKRARKNDSKGPDYDIFEVTHNDVLSGRGNGVAHSPGNIQFREVVLSHKAAYVQTDNLDLKAALAEDVISTITILKPPGRFLEKNPNGEGWREMTKRQVFAKTCQALREKAHWNAVANFTRSSTTTGGAAHTPDKMNAMGDGKANAASRKGGDSIVPTDISEPSSSSVVSPVASALATMDDDDTASTVSRAASPATTADASYKTAEAIMSPPSSTSKPVKTKTKAKASGTVKNHKEPPATTLSYQRKQKGAGQAIDPNPEYCIFQTSETDVLSGRGNGVATRPGNAYFRRLVYFHKDAYVEADRDGKIAVAKTVIAAIHKLTPPGRFLEKDPRGAGWREMTDRQVFLKTCQALREKTHWGNHAKEANQNFSPSDCLNGLVVGTTAAATAASAGNSPNARASKVQALPSQKRLGVDSKKKKRIVESSKGGDGAANQDTKCSPPPSAAAGNDHNNEDHRSPRSSVSIENGSPATVVNTSDQQIVKSHTRLDGDGTEAGIGTAATITTDHGGAAADTCEV